MCREQSRRSLPCPPGTEGPGWEGWAEGWPGLPGRRSGGQSLLRWTFSVASAWPPSGVGGWPLGGRGKQEPSPHRGQWKEKPGSDSAAHPPPPAPSPPSRAPAGPVAHGLVTLQAADGLGAAQRSLCGPDLEPQAHLLLLAWEDQEPREAEPSLGRGSTCDRVEKEGPY